jgi:3-oxoacyl-[acyl-carrier protein] reductase
MTKTDLQGRVCLITGATDGHGKAVALALAERGAELILLARNQEKALAVQDEIARASGGKRPEIVLGPDRSAISTCPSPRQTISGSGLRFLRSRWALR